MKYDLYTINKHHIQITGETQDEVINLARQIWDALAPLVQWRSARP